LYILSFVDKRLVQVGACELQIVDEVVGLIDNINGYILPCLVRLFNM